MATKNFGVIVKYGDSTPSTAIGKLKKVSLDGITWEDIDITTFDSEDAFREFMAGIADAGTFQAEIQYDKTQCATILALGGLTKAFSIIFPDGATAGAGSHFDFNGYMNNFGGFDSDVGSVSDLVMSCTFKISGKPTFTAAT